jgi:putative membrane protein
VAETDKRYSGNAVQPAHAGIRESQERTKQRMMGGGMEWGWGWMFSGGLWMLLFWGGLIGLVVLALRGLAGGSLSQTNRGSTPHQSGPTPLEILQARYARGEISQEEYQQIKTTLQL